MGRDWNEELHRIAVIEWDLESRVDHRVLRWLVHVERVDDCHMARRVLISEVSGERVRGRPRKGWMDCVDVTLSSIAITVEAARQYAKESKE